MHDARSATFVKQSLSNCPCTFVSKQQPQVQFDSTNLQHNFKFRMSQPNQCFNSDRKISCNVVSYIKPKSIRPHSCPNSGDHASLWTHFFWSLPIGQIFLLRPSKCPWCTWAFATSRPKSFRVPWYFFFRRVWQLGFSHVIWDLRFSHGEVAPSTFWGRKMWPKSC